MRRKLDLGKMRSHLTRLSNEPESWTRAGVVPRGSWFQRISSWYSRGGPW